VTYQGYKDKNARKTYNKEYMRQRRAEDREAKQYYYMEVYKASDEEKDVYSKTLTEILKTFFECARLDVKLGVSAGVAESLPVLTLKTSDASCIPKVSVQTSVEGLIPWYRRVGERFYETYKTSLSEMNMSVSDVLENMRVYQHFTLQGLKDELQRLEELKRKRIYMGCVFEVDRAEKFLENTISHPDVHIAYQLLEKRRKTIEDSEQLYLEAMLLLKREGFGYFEADKASAGVAFILGKDDDPYIFLDDKFLPNFRRHLTGLKVHSNPALSEWYEREREDTEQKREIWLVNYYEEQRKREEHNAWRENVKSWLTGFIEKDGYLAELRVEMEKVGYNESAKQEVLEMWEALCKTVKRKVVRAKIILDEEKKE